MIRHCPFMVPMTGRSPDEVHRAATPLELFFDLVFVVAIALAAAALHHAIADGHPAEGVGKYLMVFFAIWWAWMNFTWFASSYDTDDVPYRLAALLQLTGALILAAGVSSAFADLDFTVVTVGYVVMRVALVLQWLRAARSDPANRQAALRMATGVTLAQVGWVGLLFAPPSWTLPGFFLLAGVELLIPAWASMTAQTFWHAHHIAERYGLLTIIVLGESILAAATAFQASMEAGELSRSVLPIAGGGVLIVFSLWWIYFDREAHVFLYSMRRAFAWGYGHYLIFASGAAVGAGLAVAVDQATGHAHIGPFGAGMAVAVPVAVFLCSLWYLHRHESDPLWAKALGPTVAGLVLLTPFTGQAVLFTGMLLVGLVAIKIAWSHHMHTTAARLATTGVLLLAVAGCSQEAPEGAIQAEADAAYDLLLVGGTVIDGSGGTPFRADVAVSDDRIVSVSADGIDPERAARILDVEGLVVAPGFIDNHAHIQTTIHRHPLAENFTRQGITTIIASLHSGDQPWPLADYASSLDVAVNVGFFAGHSWTRTRVLGLEDRDPTPEELDHMRAVVDSTMQQGALGLSTGLLYVPANYAETEEIIELAKVAARHGGLYVSHMRNEASGLFASVAEVIRIAREADIPAQINHHKASGRAQWGQSVRTLAMIDSANAEGLDVKHDLYPYTASSTGSSILFPQWMHAGGPEEFRRRVDDPALSERIVREMRALILSDRPGNDMRRIQIRVLRADPRYNGKTVADILADRGLPNSLDAAIPVLIELQKAGGFSAIYHAMEEEDVIRIMQHPLAMIETDGDPVAWGDGFPHPRSYGAFPRVLGHYVRELGALDLATAVRKMTRMPAEQYGQLERGLVAEGMLADLTVFDPETVSDMATFTDPHRYAVGIHHVVVNGRPVILDGAFTGERPGRWLRGPARPDRVQSASGRSAM